MEIKMNISYDGDKRLTGYGIYSKDAYLRHTIKFTKWQKIEIFLSRLFNQLNRWVVNNQTDLKRNNMT